ncbi:nitronate monooxygenase [Chitinophaga sp. 30R24]|uniref:nitronate monooxygenase n=1 Tax=Chitinophaga sp. 30R24 TaxID=3248838 RepID=UPI003B921AAF
MWYQTKATSITGIKYPIIQGPLGDGLSTTQLLSAVSNAGGLGSYGAHTCSPEQIIALNKKIRTLTPHPYNINLWVSNGDEEASTQSLTKFAQLQAFFQPYFDELSIPIPTYPSQTPVKFEAQATAVLQARPPVFSFAFGIPPAAIIRECRQQHIITIGTATTLEEAVALEEASVDLVIATGIEAGWHCPAFLHPAENNATGIFVLIQQLTHRIKTPVIAAGGIADGKGIAAALTLGAAGVQIGTAFLACEESGATNTQKQRMFADDAMQNIQQQPPLAQEATRSFYLQSLFLLPLKEAAIAQHKTDLLTFWYGTISSILRHTNATKLMQALIADTTAILKK